MFRKVLEAFTSVSGSRRTDARYEASRIARRCTIAFELSGDEAFRTLGRRALLTHQAVDDPGAAADNQLSATIALLKEMAAELDGLENARGLRQRVSAAIRARAVAKESG